MPFLQRRRWLPLLLLGLLLGRPCQADPLAGQQRVTTVTAVVLGILGYADWPDAPSLLALCVVGPAHYAAGLLSGGLRQRNGRPLLGQRRTADDPWLGEACHAVYLGSLAEPERRQVFATLAGHAVLTIGEGPECAAGTMFCLDLSQPQVPFAVDLAAVAASPVHVHPFVLRLGNRRDTS